MLKKYPASGFDPVTIKNLLGNIVGIYLLFSSSLNFLPHLQKGFHFFLISKTFLRLTFSGSSPYCGDGEEKKQIPQIFFFKSISGSIN